jgi:PAS domain S-box-containing protein
LRDSRGKVRGGVVVFRDISERKRAEERLQRLSSAVEQTADSVLITDRAGVIEYVNPAFEATTGYSSAEAIGRTPNLLKSGKQSDDYYRELWATILRGEPFRGTTINRKKNGSLYWAEQTITALKDTEGRITHFVSVLKDMTERRKVQEQEIELQLAATVQQHLFPDAPPRVAGYDLAGAAFPATATCGDYYDFVPMPDGALALVVADVSGHGLGPALVMAQTRAYLRSLCLTTSDLALIAGGINRFLEHDLQENFFVTMLLVRLEPASGRLTWVNCAHPCGFVVDRSGHITAELASRCLPLGLFLDRWKCSTDEAVLHRGEIAVLVTDGILESASPDGIEFGEDRCFEVVSQHLESSAAEIVEAIFLAVQEFTGGQEQADDVTIMVCKRL